MELSIEHLRPHDITDLNSCSSSESGGISNLTLLYQGDLYDSSSTGSLAMSRAIRDKSHLATPTSTITIGQIHSPRPQHVHGKLCRPRRRSHRNLGNLNISSNLSNCNMRVPLQRRGSGASIGRSDFSNTSLDSASDHSLLSRHTAASKSIGKTGSHGLQPRGTSSNNLNSNGNQQHSFPSDSLLRLMGESSYLKTKDISPSALISSLSGKYQREVHSLYRKHHHNPQPHHLEPYAAMPTSLSFSSLSLIFSEFSFIFLFCYRCGIRFLQKACLRFRRRFMYVVLLMVLVPLGFFAWLCFDFYADAVGLCMPPSSHHIPSHLVGFMSSTEDQPYTYNSYLDNNNGDHPPRLLVEYYVHGRGIGHYARSIAIVEKLNRAGVDVRMFLTRASLWRAVHEDSKIVDIDVDQQQHENQRNYHRGKTTAIAITSLLPNQGFIASLSHVLERISGDCEVSLSSGRYPHLVISDGDFPGMIRAELGGIPSVGIAHGQLFSIAQKPTWVQESTQLNQAWNKQGRLNHVSSFFTEWQVATHFCFLESRYHSGTVARAPLRPEVLRMAEARKWARNGKVTHSVGEKHQIESPSATNKKIPPPPQVRRLQKLLLSTGEAPIHAGANNKTSLKAARRKLVICYFRDHNGEHVVRALLDADFDVLLFDVGYTRGMANNPHRYGVKWMISDQSRNMERKKYIMDVDDKNGDDNVDANQLRGGQNVSRDIKHKFLSNKDHGREGSVMSNTSSVNHHGFEVLRQKKNGPKLIRVMDRSLFIPLMHVADGVASSAGSQLMSECIYSRIPLLAMYKEDDSEQQLNVELSRRTNAPCHPPLVFGNSFESLELALPLNLSAATESFFDTNDDNSRASLVFEPLNGFIQEVKSSHISNTHFHNTYLFGSIYNISKEHFKKTSQNGHGEMFDRKDTNFRLEDDPFGGLPDAAAIILEIIKQVIQKGEDDSTLRSTTSSGNKRMSNRSWISH